MLFVPPKGHSMNNLSQEDIDFIVERINSLPRKILGYKTPDEVFENELDLIFAAKIFIIQGTSST